MCTLIRPGRPGAGGRTTKKMNAVHWLLVVAALALLPGVAMAETLTHPEGFTSEVPKEWSSTTNIPSRDPWVGTADPRHR